MEDVLRDALFTCIWEAEIPRERADTIEMLGRWADRMELEAALAAEAGLAPSEIVSDALTSSAYRELPPVFDDSAGSAVDETTYLGKLPYIFHLFVAPTTGRDYQRRLRRAAERRLGEMGAVPRSTTTHE